MSKRKGRRPNATGRNGEDQYVKLPYGLVRDPAWRSLGGASVKVWLELRCRYNGGNNGKLTLSMDEASRVLGMGKATVKRAFDELQDRGFLRMTKRGQWYGRLATEWRVTDQGCDGHMATRDWTKWQPSKKRQLGAKAEPSSPATVPFQNRSPGLCSASEPVRLQNGSTNGSKMEC